ncbi:MAG TPA: NusA-like transcription termination signal-binding factor [Candidatus Woesearchaeota archaeon]|nr:NusA-like transcription termination signal-binding factor [Candidatus Woesearchaeota archaeon]
MTGIKLSLDDIAFINLFEKTTKASVKDCIVDEQKNKITFVVNEGHIGMAIGRGGANIKKLEHRMNKKLEVIEFSKDPLKFLTNLLRPIKVKNAYVSERSDGKKTVYASVMRDRMGMVKTKVKNARNLLEKYYKFDDIIIQ